MKKIIMIVLAVIVVIGAVGAMAGGNEDGKDASETKPSKTEETKKDNKQKKVSYKKITAAQLQKDLEENAAAASDKYKGGHYKITGKFGSIDSDGAYFNLDGDDYSFTLISCYIQNDKQLDQLKKLKKGQEVTVCGEITDVGEFMGYSVKIAKIK